MQRQYVQILVQYLIYFYHLNDMLLFGHTQQITENYKKLTKLP